MMIKLIFTTAVISIAMVSCDNSTEIELTPQQQGMELLGHNRYIEAGAIFEQLLDENPNNQEVRYAAGIAAVGETIDQINFLTTLILAFVGDLEDIADITPEAANENEFLLNMINDVIGFLAEPSERAMNHLSQVEATTTLQLPDFQIRFWQTDFVEASGTWDYADARLVLAALSPVRAAFGTLAAHDLRFDVYLLIHNVLGPTLPEGVPAILNLVVQVLSTPDYQNFLGLKPDTGAAAMVAVAEALALGTQAYNDAIGAASDRPEGQGIVDIGESDDGDPALILRDRVRFVGDDKLDISFRIQEGGYWGTVVIETPEATSQALAKLSRHFKGEEALVDIYDGLNALLPAILGILPHLELPGDLVDLIAPLASPEIVIGFVEGAIPPGLAFSPNSFLRSGQGIRSFLPAYRTDLAPRENNFLIEWECADYAPDATNPIGSTGAFPAGEVSCDEDAKLKDAKHFDAPIYVTADVDAINPDGLATRWPIIAFNDPSWAGLLHIDASVVVEDGNPNSGLKPATNLTFNAWVAQLESTIGSFF